jgi:hypothetical protein
MSSSNNSRETLQMSASEVITALRDFMHQELAMIHTRLALVDSIQAGPPPTLTVTIYDDLVPGIRYIGSAPSVGDTVVLLADGPYYICMGALAE